MPTDDPRAEAVGSDPDRILLLGSGKSVGFGVTTHQLGLGGHLARQLAGLTRRGCSVDIVSDFSMSVADTRVIIGRTRLEKFDALVLTLGGIDVLRMRSLFVWRRDVSVLLDTVKESGGGVLQSFIVGVAPPDDIVSLPPILLRFLNFRIASLNAITQELCTARSDVTFIPATPPIDNHYLRFESHTYEHWAREIVPTISFRLAHVAVPPPAVISGGNGDTAFDGSSLSSKRVSVTLTALTHSARVMLTTSGAAITFHDHEAHWFTSLAGAGDMRREDAGTFCSSAFATRGLVVVEDTLLDKQLLDHPWVVTGPRIRFYAGYPILATNGDVIGVVCVFDVSPRAFDSSHESLLRELALRAESAILYR